VTDEAQDIIAKAEALLANATPGKWAARHDGDHYDAITTDAGELDGPVYGYQGDVGFNRPADAEFIAAAPELVRELMAEVKRLRAIVENFRRVRNNSAFEVDEDGNILSMFGKTQGHITGIIPPDLPIYKPDDEPRTWYRSPDGRILLRPADEDESKDGE
jgi:hypothetical protein